jgi:sec-independent protein translocase protein TatC
MEAFPLRGVAHDERLTVTQHLSELRARLLLSVAVLAVLFAGCLWQSRSLLHVLNAPLAHLRTTSAQHGSGSDLSRALARSGGAFTRLAHASSLAPSDRQAALSAAHSLAAASRSLAAPEARAPVTLGLGEPFSTSITVAFAFALLVALPFLLAQVWAFVAPAIGPAERQAVRPLLMLAPVLFVAGAAFAYFVVLTPAVTFLQGFNHGAFDTLVQARPYYRFEIMTMIALGAMFEIPALLLALGRAGVLSSTTLRTHRGYALLALSVLGALLPGTDPVSTLLEALPLFALYEATILLLRLSERRRARRQALSG